MEHDGWDGFDADDPDLGGAETADLGDGGLPHDPDQPWPVDDLTDGDDNDGVGDDGDPEPGDLNPGAGDGPGRVDAHVDEPLGFDPDTDSGPGTDGGVDPDPDLGPGDPAADPDGPDPDGDPPTYADPVFGAAHDGDPHADGWTEPQFPPALDLSGLPDPVDGEPWTDPGLLGSAPVPDPGPQAGMVPTADLFGYAGIEAGAGDPWATLVAAEDPATSALARFWAPGG